LENWRIADLSTEIDNLPMVIEKDLNAKTLASELERPFENWYHLSSLPNQA
jgi:hypothetical protein